MATADYTNLATVQLSGRISSVDATDDARISTLIVWASREMERVTGWTFGAENVTDARFLGPAWQAWIDVDGALWAETRTPLVVSVSGMRYRCGRTDTFTAVDMSIVAPFAPLSGRPREALSHMVLASGTSPPRLATAIWRWRWITSAATTCLALWS